MSTFKDQRNIIKHLNIQRVWNLVMLRFSYGLARLFKIQKNWGKPFALSIEPTTACNLGCPACPSG